MGAVIVACRGDDQVLNPRDDEPGAASPAMVSTSVFLEQPPSNMGVDLAFPVAVMVHDAFGNRDSSFTGEVRIALATNPADGILSGTIAVVAEAGYAPFRDLRIDRVGTGYTLSASAGDRGGE